MTKIFIDGSAGTTGLRIRERLSTRDDIELIVPDDDVRKDASVRKTAIERSDIAILCLPDDAATETVGMVYDTDTVIIDTSTAHRTSEGWTYGFPELMRGEQRELIRASRRIANPGCHAGGFIALIAPLAESGLIGKDAALSCFSLTGYSGGGKKMIAEYEAAGAGASLRAPRQYAISQSHKHLKEMKQICGLVREPLFCPVVGDFYSGMEVSIPVFASDIKGSIEDVRQLYREYYSTGLVRYSDSIDDGGFVSAASMQGRDDMIITVAGNEERLLLIALFDNLGKGASGAAIQNVNIVMGTDEDKGLAVHKA